MTRNSLHSSIQTFLFSSSLLAVAATAFLIMVPVYAAQERLAVRSQEAAARYEAGLKAARKLLAVYDRQATGKPEFADTYSAEDEFVASLRANGKEGVEAAEFVAERDLPLRETANVRNMWRPLTRYLAGQGFAWGRPHLNNLLRSEQVPFWTRTMIIEEIDRCTTQPGNWLDDEAALPFIRSLLANNDFYATEGVLLDGEPPLRLELAMRYCDLGVRLLCDIYEPPGVKWIGVGTKLAANDVDSQRNYSVEAAKRWIETRLARIATRRDLLDIAAHYYRTRLTRVQVATLLDLWAGLESRNPAGNIRDVKALANMLLEDLRRTAGSPRDALEKDFHSLVHDRLAGMLAKAGFKPEGAENNLPANSMEEREWLRNAVHKLARGAAPDQWMRYEWEKYHVELGEAVLADIKAAEPQPPAVRPGAGKAGN